MPEADSEIVGRLSGRGRPRTEADIQSDVRALLLTGALELHDAHVSLEAPVDGRRRIDVEVGSTVIETKKDLTLGRVRKDAEEQLTGYLRERQARHGSRYVGVITDGREWRDYHLDPSGELVAVSRLEVQGPDDVNALLLWLEGILATRDDITPSPEEIERRLGAWSSATQLDLSELASIYRAHAELPTIAIKRELWARLLTVAFGTAFEDDAELFVSHTYLTVAAEMIAHAVLRYDLRVEANDPDVLLLGHRFRDAGIAGVVESDFFDWVLEVPEGRSWVSSLAKRLARFDWSDVQHDVLKILYETVIDPETRHGLGEYYTPDWLASSMLPEVFVDPASQRLADVACGSGTFIFHAVRAAAEACESVGMTNADVIASVTARVFGMDVHPVAVTLARVTYLLALGTERLAGERTTFGVPVYLGDAVSFQEQHGLFDDQGLTVYTTDGLELFETDLRFPERVVSDVRRFDQLLSEMADRAVNRSPGTTPPSIREVYNRYAIHPDDRSVLDRSFATLCRLQDDGRNHIWGYYVRNAARPGWLARPENRVDVLIGNPPWLAYNFMPEQMQDDFRRLSTERGLWPAAQVVTKQDLAGLFVVRSVERYLRQGGVFGFVMPESALSRTTYLGFREGRWQSPAHSTLVEFGKPWDLKDVQPQPFPVPCCVVFGTRSSQSSPLAGELVAWSGGPSGGFEQEIRALVSAPTRDADWSPYRERFTQGAILSPRVLFMIDKRDAGHLGLPAGQVRVESSRSSLEKEPWKNLPSLSGQIESRFVYPIHSGNSVLPHRLLEPELAALPWDGERLLEPESSQLDRWPGYCSWWRAACELWRTHRTGSASLSLAEQLDYRGKFRAQMGSTGPLVFYSSSGNHLAAAWTMDVTAVVNNRLYWASARDQDEARFLTSILNSPHTTARVEPLMGRGAFGTRDFHLWVWALPIPTFDPENSLHRELVDLAEGGERIAAAVDVEDVAFQRARGLVRTALRAAGITPRSDELVEELLLQQTRGDA
jgi:hypothetical protein